MAVSNDMFPSFSEMCQRARDMERKLIPQPKGEMEGEIRAHGESEIFPKEFEEYTYSFMLGEAQRMERQLSLSGRPLPQAPIMQAIPQPKAEGGKIAQELHGFATPRYIYSDKKDDAQVAEAEQAATIPTALQAQGKEPQPEKQGAIQAGIPGGGKAPPTMPIPSPPQVPALQKKEKPAAQASEQWESPTPAPIPGGQSYAEPQGEAPLPEKDEAEAGFQPPKPSFMASSKISPRLRAIIEEKLRREEATRGPRKEAEDIEIKAPEAGENEEKGESGLESGGGASEPQGQGEALSQMQGGKEQEPGGQEPVLPLPKRKDWQSDAAKQEGQWQEGVAPKPIVQRRAAQLEEAEGEGGPNQEAMPAPVPGLAKKKELQARPEEVEERQRAEAEGPQEEPAEIEKAQAPPEIQLQSFKSRPQSEAGLKIKPLFKDDVSGKPGAQPALESDSQKRLARIQRIIDGLSSDSPPEKPEEPPEGDGKGGKGGQTKEEGKKGEAKAQAEKKAAFSPKIVPRGITAPAKAKKGARIKAGKPPAKQMAAEAEKAGAPGQAKEKAPLEKEPKKMEVPKKKVLELPTAAKASLGKVPTDGGKPTLGKPTWTVPRNEGKPTISKPAAKAPIEAEKQLEVPPSSVHSPAPGKSAAGAQRKIAPRIFPGGKLTPTVSPKTYVPPARKEPLSTPIARDSGAGEGKAAGEGGTPQAVPGLPPAFPPATQGQEERQAISSPQQPKSERSEIAGKALLPKEEDELAIPAPKQEDELPVPKPEEYGEAKDDLRRRLADLEKIDNAKKEAEGYLEQYAKQNILWLYELYKMGALPREEFLQKVKEKIAEASGKAGEPPIAQNPALANLSQQIDKNNK